MDLGTFAVDTEMSEEGVWCDVGDSRLKIARYGNKKFQRALERGMAPYKRLAAQGRLDDDVVKSVLIDCMSRYVLLDWENLTKDGELIEYSVANAKDILSDPKLEGFRELVIGMAQENELFRKEEAEDIVEK